MASRAKAETIADKANVSEELSSIENLISDLELRLRKLNNTVRADARGASRDVSDFVSEALAGITQRVRESSDTFTENAAERATKVGTAAFKRIAQEIERRPLILLAVAAGVGFLLGMARK